ncbi:MAG: Arm DNA-binding domain-containing protein [Eubacteriales bacterium]|nr:Arm DNA-binding domain-containing protein [Eubacteriales bacterium]
MAEVFTRKRGKFWQYRFYGATINGKRQEICKGGFRTKKEAQLAGNKALTEYTQAGRHFVASEISVADYFDEWLKLRSVELKQTTLSGYQKRTRNYILPVIGKYKLKAVTASNLQALINDLFNQGFSRNTLTSIKGILTNAFGYAVEPLHYIQLSPMIGVRLPSVRATPPVPQRKKSGTQLPHNSGKN